MKGSAQRNGSAELAPLLRAVSAGTAWNYAAFAAAKAAAFLATIVLARLLVPDDFGLVALGLLVLRFLESARSLGIGAAVIQRQEEPERSAHVAFGLSVTMGTLLAAAVYAAAPLVAAYFHDPRVMAVLRVLAVCFVLSGLRQVHESRLQKELQFRRRFIPQVGGAAVKGGVSILLAWMGAGVWSLVWGQLCGEAIHTLLYWLVSRWRPRLLFIKEIARSLLRFGLQIVVLELLGVLVNNLDYVFIGRRLDADQLGLYTMAFRLPELIVLGLCYVVSKATFPAYAKLQQDPDSLAAGFLKFLRYISLLTVPMGVGMLLVAPEFVEVVYGRRWLAAIQPMQLLVVHALALSLAFDAGNVYKAMGRAGVLTRFAFLRLLVVAPVLWIAAGHGITHVAAGQAAASVLFACGILATTCWLLPVRPGQLLSSLRTPAAGGGVMALGLLALRPMIDGWAAAPRLALLVACGVALYALGVWLVDRDLVRQLTATGRR